MDKLCWNHNSQTINSPHKFNVIEDICHKIEINLIQDCTPWVGFENVNARFQIQLKNHIPCIGLVNLSWSVFAILATHLFFQCQLFEVTMIMFLSLTWFMWFLKNILIRLIYQSIKSNFFLIYDTFPELSHNLYSNDYVVLYRNRYYMICKIIFRTLSPLVPLLPVSPRVPLLPWIPFAPINCMLTQQQY